MQCASEYLIQTGHCLRLFITQLPGERHTPAKRQVAGFFAANKGWVTAGKFVFWYVKALTARQVPLLQHTLDVCSPTI